MCCNICSCTFREIYLHVTKKLEEQRNAQIKELKILYKYYPKLWQELKEMDKKSYNQFRADYSVEQLEEKFRKEL
ncbi:MAG: hypothetical protein EGQ54_06250 [[Ruminococcus] lactaris]|nr:hypothetical protein [[Ruminococcus] lactaris]